MVTKRNMDMDILRSVLFKDADEDVTAIMNSAGTPEDALHWMLEAAGDAGLAGTIDWRSELDETVESVDLLLSRFNVLSFDWTFIDLLVDLEQGEVLRNCNFLMHVQDQLKAIGLNFVHLGRFNDGYTFAVVSDVDLAKINGMFKAKCISISTDFGPDAYYAVGKAHLAATGFCQPAVGADLAVLQQKHIAKKLETLKKCSPTMRNRMLKKKIIRSLRRTHG